MGIPLVRGRFFAEHELGIDSRADSGSIIINETMADIFWPDQDPIGKRLQWGDPDPNNPWLTVVGVVGDTRAGALDEVPISSGYMPFATSRMHLVVRADGDPKGLIPSVEAAVQALDPDVPLSNVTTAADWYTDSIAQRRFQTLVLLLFAAAAVVLAASGIYGVMHDSVQRRQREIGIRMAVGAGAGRVLRMVLGVYGISPTDPLTLMAASAALIGVATLASLVPARRATHVDPVESLNE